MRRLLLPAVLSTLIAGCSTAPLPRGATARVAILPPAASLPRSRSDDLVALRQLAIHLVEAAPRLRAVPVQANRRLFKKQLRRATRRCRSRKCRAAAKERLVGATHGLSYKITRRGRRCLVSVRLERFAKRKARLHAKRSAACTDSALAASLTGATCEILTTSHATTQKECGVEGEIFWLDRMSRDLLAGRLKLQRNKVAERILGLKGAYLDIARRAGPRLGVTAHCRAAWLYDQLAHHMTPKGEKPKGDAAAFRRQAATLYRACIAQARRDKVPAPGAAEARLKQIESP